MYTHLYLIQKINTFYQLDRNLFIFIKKVYNIIHFFDKHTLYETLYLWLILSIYDKILMWS